MTQALSEVLKTVEMDKIYKNNAEKGMGSAEQSGSFKIVWLWKESLKR